MSSTRLNYPRSSTNPNRDRSRFWNAMGMAVGDAREVSRLSDTLFRAPTARYEENSFLVNKPGSGQEAEGKMSLRAARKLLGDAVDEGDELVLRLLEAGRSPESVNTYDAFLKVEALSDEEREVIPVYYRDPIMLQEIPDGFGYGKNYDFTVIHHGSDYIFDPSSVKP